MYLTEEYSIDEVGMFETKSWSCETKAH
jgi:hypothetical protein